MNPTQETSDLLADRPLPDSGRFGVQRFWFKSVLHWLRRGHLYFGLFLLPWTILYGITAFLFNHPTAFSDQPTQTFSREMIRGTPLESLPTPEKQAAEVVEALNAKQNPKTPYKLVNPEGAKYNREFAFATIKMEDRQIGLLVDVKHGSGTIRATPEPPKKEIVQVPFATEKGEPGRGSQLPPNKGKQPNQEANTSRNDSIVLFQPLPERVKSSIPTILERMGLPSGEITITSVPELVFSIEADGKIWTAIYNPMTGSVGGKLREEDSTTEISFRRFLLRLHTAHGYPDEPNARWFWALIVDGMAFVMVFWGISGLLMWWQIKAIRRIGLVVLLLSATVATGIGFAMHMAMTG